MINAVYVDRERKDGEEPLQPLADALANGDSLILFPEGTRGHAEEPQPFKAGIYNLATRFPHVVPGRRPMFRGADIFFHSVRW